MTESQEQRQLIQWCQTDPRLQFIFHISNESVGGPGWLTRNRQMGVKPGVPDLFYPVPMKGYHGLFSEMKTKTCRLSTAQRRWLNALNDMGDLAVVARGWEEAKCQIMDYLNIKKS